MLIENFYGFDKDGEKIFGRLRPSGGLVEKDLDQTDINYIKSNQSYQLYTLGIKLDKRKFQSFEKSIKREKSHKKQCKYYEYDGKLYTIYELSKISGVKRMTLYNRIHTMGWDINEAIITNTQYRGIIYSG